MINRIPESNIEAMRFQFSDIVAFAAAIVEDRVLTVQVVLSCQRLHGCRELVAIYCREVPFSFNLTVGCTFTSDN